MKLAEFITLYNPEIVLEKYQREFIERLEYLDFADLERRVLATPYRPGGMTNLVLGVDFGEQGDQTAVCIAHKIRGVGDEAKIMIIDDVYIDPERNRYCFDEKLFTGQLGHYEGFRLMEAPMVQESEPTAKNGTKASKKTERAKAKLPFYHKNRRF